MTAPDHPPPWQWKEPLDAYEEPVLLDANGDIVCSFGESGVAYEEKAGMPPSGSVAAALIMLAPELADALRDARAEIAEWRANAPSSGARPSEVVTRIDALLARLPKPAEGGEG